MPVTFINPGLLLGALAAVVPIVIHFLSRRKVRRLAFSDLRFLEAAQTRQSRRIGVRRLLLLLLRVLAILCVVLAVARPKIGGLARTAQAARSVLFVLDSSASMQTQQDKGTRFAAALQDCEQMVAALPAGSEVQILLAATTAEPLFASWLPARGPVGAALAAARPTAGSFALAEALRSAADWLPSAQTQPIEIVLLADLQDAPQSIRAVRDACGELERTGLYRFLIRRIGDEVADGGVRALHLPQRAVRPGESLELAAEVRLEKAEQVFRLELDGRRIAEAVAVGEAGSIGKVEFTLTAPAAGQHRGRISKESDRLPVDDARPFVLTVWERVKVLLVHGADRGAAGRGGWRYLAEALAPAGDENSLFAVEAVGVDQLVAGDLARHDLVLGVDPDPLGRQLLAGLLTWLADGAAAAFWLGDPTSTAYLEQTLLPAFGLPPEVEFRVSRAGSHENQNVLAASHPLFQGLDVDAISTLSDIPFRRFHVWSEGEGQVLLEFTGESPALLELRHGLGTILLWPYSLNLTDSDLALSPMFLPLAQRTAAYLARHAEKGAGTLINAGEQPLIRVQGSRGASGSLDDAAQLKVGLPEGTAPAELIWSNGVPTLVGPSARDAGFYTFTAGADTLGTVAAVTPASEGNPQLRSVREFRDYLLAAGLKQTADLGQLAPADFAAVLTGREISGWLIAAAILLLCGEIYLARGAR